MAKSATPIYKTNKYDLSEFGFVAVKDMSIVEAKP